MEIKDIVVAEEKLAEVRGGVQDVTMANINAGTNVNALGSLSVGGRGSVVEGDVAVSQDIYAPSVQSIFAPIHDEYTKRTSFDFDYSTVRGSWFRA